MKRKKNNYISLRHYEIVERLLSSVRKGAKVLDMGCGEGGLSLRLYKKRLNVFACDIENRIYKSKNIHFQNVDLNKKLLYESNYFNTVICLEVVEHLQNPWLLIKEIHRILEPNGQLILSSPNTSNCLARVYNLLTGEIWLFRKFTTDHINPISYWELERILKENNFKKIDLVEGVNVIKKAEEVTTIRNPIIKIIYCLIFQLWDIIHSLLNGNNNKYKLLFRNFSYIIYAQK